METWVKYFTSDAGDCCMGKVGIGIFVQIDKQGLVQNVYCRVELFSISMMGEGRSEFIGNEMFPMDQAKAEQFLAVMLGEKCN